MKGEGRRVGYEGLRRDIGVWEEEEVWNLEGED